MKDEEPFDAVRTMREIRDRMDREFAGLSVEEQRRRMREATDAERNGGVTQSHRGNDKGN